MASRRAEGRAPARRPPPGPRCLMPRATSSRGRGRSFERLDGGEQVAHADRAEPLEGQEVARPAGGRCRPGRGRARRRTAGRPCARRGPRCPSRPRDAKWMMRWSRWYGQAGSTQRVSASPSSRTSGVPQRARAHGGERPRLGAVGAQAEDRADHLGDHVAGLAHDDGVAGPHVLQADLVLVVQRGHADRGAADEHRLEHGEGRGPAGAADRHLDVAAAGWCAPRAGT